MMDEYVNNVIKSLHIKFVIVRKQVVVKILGDLANGKSLKVYSSKYLLIPTLKHWTEEELPVQYTVREIIDKIFNN